MRSYILRIGGVFLIFFLVGLFLQFHSSSKYSSDKKAQPVVGNVNVFVSKYEQWKRMAKKSGADRNLVLPLGYSKALSFKFTNAHGIVKLDLANGFISVEVSGLPEKDAFDVWLVDNKGGPKDSVKPEPWDKMVRVGSLKRESKTLRLEARLDPEALKNFKIDLIAIAQDNKNPGETGLLFGSPSLFQRLYYNEQRGQVAKLGFDTSNTTGLTNQTNLSFPLNFLVPKPVLAVGEGSPTLEELTAEGAELFFGESFDGNGRTCGTCHPLENNFTIDPKFIEQLPNTNNNFDPLFVAEHIPALKNLEKPDLMHQFGLILENVDGLDNPTQKFVMRGVPHTLGLTKSIQQDTSITANERPAEMTGWSGDGAPGSGSLREFATGAVTQHFTKTLNRKPGKDFRLPNDGELDAMEAFQLSLGRQKDPDLSPSGLELKSADARAGKTIFMLGSGDPLFPGKCSTCHNNAGALHDATGENRNFKTAVEDLPDMTARRIANAIPRDGGFGSTAINGPAGCTPPAPDCGFGNGRFNTVSLVEAADTGPFFHNNAINTIEDAVNFFNSDTFNKPGVAFAKIHLEPNQVLQVAAFLRVINALDNIRSAIQFDDKAITASNFGRAKKSLNVALSELNDAIRVLDEKDLHPNAVEDLMDAAEITGQAINTPNQSARNDLIDQAIENVISAREDMCTLGSDETLCPN